MVAIALLDFVTYLRETNYVLHMCPSSDRTRHCISSIVKTFTSSFKIIIGTSLVLGSACLTTDHEVAGSLPGTSTKFKMWIRFGTGSTQPRENNWIAT